ncbi:uncharacterized protein LOC119396327 [Rhipicephalus sanguineus]|uniref:Uncharacterized protein n=1 Tax=Rhipicephalus sanguineus TaxID=34632 RepID=A0A9D4PP29_RHISA|nr:uncharacterized protein LOC119396327 [Rhipicephalus sanguineus]KAH7948079.1 hypothetical protein HPB52_018360 [Rhipicephalus sanguineus]
MQYFALVLSIVGGTVFLGLLLAAICSYYWISQRHYPCAWSATADAKSDVYYKKTGDWKYVQNGAVPDAEEGVVTDNDEPLLGSIVLEDGANQAAHDGQCDTADSTDTASKKESMHTVTSFSSLEMACENKTAM